MNAPMQTSEVIPFEEAGLEESAGDFADLVRRMSPFVFRVAYAALRDRGAAEDAVQEAFLKLHRSGAWRAIRDERAFLARIAWRAAQKVRPRVTPVALVDDQPAQGDGPEAAAIRADLHARVRGIVATLPARYRDPLLLSTSGELNSREIAEALGMPEGTVRSNILRARQMVKAKLAEQEAKHG